MKFQTITEADAVLDEMACGNLRVRINRLGAEMISFARKRNSEWVGLIYRDGSMKPPISGGWLNHAIVMGYYVHLLWEGKSSYRGQVITGGNHGFIRHFAFPEPQRLEDGLMYQITADAVPKDAYPLRVSLDLSYRLVGETLRVDFEFHNEETDLDAHVSFGLHPAFAVETVATARILFPAGTYQRFQMPGNFLNGTVETIHFAGGEMPFPKSELRNAFLIGIEELANRKFAVENPEKGTRVTLDFSEVPYVTIWSNADDFICIEPCWGLPDDNPPVAFEKKLGIQVIPPQGTLRRSFSIQPEFLT